MNTIEIVNSGGLTDVGLEKSLAETFRNILRTVAGFEGWEVEPNRTGSNQSFHLRAVVPLPPKGVVEFFVECKPDPRPSLIPNVNLTNHFGPSGERRVQVPVLAAPHISPRMAEVCANRGWSWFDLAGNCQIRVPGTFFHIERTGRAPVHTPPRPRANLASTAAGRVVRSLLVPENAGRSWTQRALALECGTMDETSLGLVNKVMRHLREESFLEPGPEGGSRLRDPLGLLAAWGEAYRFDRHVRRHWFTPLRGRGLQDALLPLESMTGGHAAYASFSAAEFQAPHVRQPKTWLFLGAAHEEEVRAAVKAEPVDSGENIVALIPEDNGVFYQQESGGPGLSRTTPVQTYVDLCHGGGRGAEAAEALLEQNLKPAWRKRRLLL